MIPTGIINQQTGLPPTESEWRHIQEAALRIFRNPYAAPELMDWAINMYPEGFAEAFELRITDNHHWPQQEKER